MHKIIHSSFEFDLTPYGVSTVEENHWFSDGFFTKYSFPFTFKLEGELLRVFGDLLDHNNVFNETEFEVTYAHGDKLEPAIFEITENQGLEFQAEFRWGIDEFPNWEKSLRDLPLETFTLPLIYWYPIAMHANTVVNQSWPTVNYNFPKVRTDALEGATWDYFQGMINNYEGTSFLLNTVEPEDGIDVIKNRNIIQPMPYLLHVLTKGIEDAGYTLQGSILDNEIIKSKLLYHNTVYADLNVWSFSSSFYTESTIVPDIYGDYYHSIWFNLEPNRRYKITGTYFIKELNHPFNNAVFFANTGDYNLVGSGLQNTQSIFRSFSNSSYPNEEGVFSSTFEISFQNTNNHQAVELVIYTGVIDKSLDYFITEVFEDEATEAFLKTEIDLTQSVPDVTFGYLITELKKHYFIDVDVDEDSKTLYMDIIEDKFKDYDVVDLTHKEVIPQKKYSSEKQVCLKYKDVDDEIYAKAPIYVTKEGVSDTEDISIVLTETINIEMFPLPNSFKNNIFTATAFENDENSLYFVIYKGFDSEAKNSTSSTIEYELERIAEKYYKSYFNLIFNSIPYSWSFVDWAENISEISKKIFAYGKHHVVKSLNKTQISQDLYEVKLETESLE